MNGQRRERTGSCCKERGMKEKTAAGHSLKSGEEKKHDDSSGVDSFNV